MELLLYWVVLKVRLTPRAGSAPLTQSSWPAAMAPAPPAVRLPLTSKVRLPLPTRVIVAGRGSGVATSALSTRVFQSQVPAPVLVK